MRIAYSLTLSISFRDHEARTRIVDVDVSFDDMATVADLVEACAGRYEIPLDDADDRLAAFRAFADRSVRSQQTSRLEDERRLLECGLVNGAQVEIRPPSDGDDEVVPAGLEPDVGTLYLVDDIGGARGRATPLHPGVKVAVGLSSEGDANLLLFDQDRAVPAAFSIRVPPQLDGGVTYAEVTPVGVALLRVSGQPVEGDVAHRVYPGSSIEIVPSDEPDHPRVAFVVTTPEGLEARSPFGQVRFDTTARAALARFPKFSESLGPRPEQPRPRRFPVENLLFPVAISAALLSTSRNPIFILIFLIQPVVSVIQHRRAIRDDEERYGEALEKWTTRKEELVDTLAALVVDEAKKRRDSAPDTGVLVDRAVHRLPELWERRAEDPDALVLQLGIGDLRSALSIEIDDRHDAELVGSIDRARLMTDVPALVDMKQVHVALIGDERLVQRLATDLIIQAACLHSPGYLAIGAILPRAEERRRTYDWLKWLPHFQFGSRVLPPRPVAVGRSQANSLITEAVASLQERLEHQAGVPEPTGSHALLVVHEESEVDRKLLDELVTIGRGRVHVLWLGSGRSRRPPFLDLVTVSLAEAGDVATLEARSGIHEWEVFRPLRSPIARGGRVGQALAPLYDPGVAGASGGIPPIAPLGAILDLDAPVGATPWKRLGKSLRIPIGVTETGPFYLDLAAQGPHFLIGGTTGSGKSELLQTMAASLVALYAPTQVTLFLVDFKGGATFTAFRELQHTIGFVSDLTPEDVSRALDFLRAELKRRSSVFDSLSLPDGGNVKDYADYVRTGARDMPRLVVIFDEFATLIQEHKLFMDGVVDIAQRGRSFGVHLILATQQPSSDVVTGKVKANVGSRIALRTLDASNSEIIIDSPEAALIPRSLQGRALFRIEQALTEFQTAWSGGDHHVRQSAEGAGGVRLEDFIFGVVEEEQANESESAASEGEQNREGTETDRLPTDLSFALTQAGRRGNRDRQTRVLGDPLSAVTRREVPETALRQSGLGTLAVGMRDSPRQQRQETHFVDLAESPLLIRGPMGSGRTSALRLAAGVFSSANSASMPAVAALDGAGGDLIGSIRDLVGLCAGTSTSALADLTVVLDRLDLLVQARRGNAETEAPDFDGHPVLVVIDDLGALVQGLARLGRGRWYEVLLRVLTQGRTERVYAVAAADDRSQLPLELRSAFRNRVALGSVGDDGETIAGGSLDPGRGFLPSGDQIQLFATDHLTVSPLDGALLAWLLPDDVRVAVGSLPPTTLSPDGRSLSVPIGTEQVSRSPVTVDLGDRHLLVVGRRQAGKSSVLDIIANNLAADGTPALLDLSPRPREDRPPMRSIQPTDLRQLWTQHGGETPQHELAFSDAVVALLDGTCNVNGQPILLIDDGHVADKDGILKHCLDLLARLGTLCLVVAADVRSTRWQGWDYVKNPSEQVLFLRPRQSEDEDDGTQVIQTALMQRPGTRYAAGEGILVDAGRHIGVTSAQIDAEHRTVWREHVPGQSNA
ncbi:MAG: hypothetical protein HYU28_07630 [Actinobacteria bacterium]|nr:hypothetical protein [Actinomycetota bacterium]